MILPRGPLSCSAEGRWGSEGLHRRSIALGVGVAVGVGIGVNRLSQLMTEAPGADSAHCLPQSPVPVLASSPGPLRPSREPQGWGPPHSGGGAGRGPAASQCPGQRGCHVGLAHVLPQRGAYTFAPQDSGGGGGALPLLGPPHRAQAAELPSKRPGDLCALSTSWPVLSGTCWRSALQKQRFRGGSGGLASWSPEPAGSWGPHFSSCRSGTRLARSASAPSRRATTAAPTGPSWRTTSPRGAPSYRCRAGSRTFASTRAPASCSCSSVRLAGRLAVSSLSEGRAELGQAGAGPGPERDLEDAVPANHLQSCTKAGTRGGAWRQSPRGRATAEAGALCVTRLLRTLPAPPASGGSEMRSDFSPVHAAPEHVKEAGCDSEARSAIRCRGPSHTSVHLQAPLKSDPPPHPPSI